jgi:hypothetical protein
MALFRLRFTTARQAVPLSRCTSRVGPPSAVLLRSGSAVFVWQHIISQLAKHQQQKQTTMKHNKHLSIALIPLVAVVGLLLVGCRTGRITIQEPPSAGALEPIKTKEAEVPIKLQLADFTVTSVEQNSENTDTESLKRYFALQVPNRLYESLGSRHVFAEVSRVAASNPALADYVITGEYECEIKNGRGFATHYSSFKGTMHIRLLDTKKNVLVYEKTYQEEHRDEASPQTPTRVQWLQPGHIAEITADIKRAIYQELGRTQ